MNKLLMLVRAFPNDADLGAEIRRIAVFLEKKEEESSSQEEVSDLAFEKYLQGSVERLKNIH